MPELAKDVFGDDITTDTKICRACEKELPLDMFEANRKYFDGSSVEKYRILRRPDCIPCRKIKKPIKNSSKKLYPKPIHNFICPICERTIPAKDAKLDHCHRTGIVRGWLCNGCNTSLGSFKDSVVVLKRAIVWLEIDRNENTIF